MSNNRYAELDQLIKEYEEDIINLRSERLVMKNYPKVLTMSAASSFEYNIKNACQDFLNNPIAQEKAQIIFKKKQWGYLKSVGSDKYIGKTINGYKITPSGLLAAAHLKGAGSVIKYLKSNGINNEKDAFGTSVENYMKKFAEYDVSKILV